MGLCPPGDEEPVEPEQDECPDQGHHKARGIVRAVQPDRPPEPAAEQGTDDAQHDGHENAAWVAPRHYQLGEGADNQPENDPAEDAEYWDLPYEPECRNGIAAPVPPRDGASAALQCLACRPTLATTSPGPSQGVGGITVSALG